jgi:dihydrodiol dehydrogenase / D-xylose 1-dehydrogenase (NADP)
LAAQKKLFLMEGMWTRFFPATQEWTKIIRSGGIGEIRSLTCSFGYFAEEHEIGRLIDPQLGGGALVRPSP